METTKYLECKHCTGTGICKQSTLENEYRHTGGYHGADDDPDMKYFYWHDCQLCGTGQKTIENAKPPVCKVCGGKGYVLG